MVTTKNITIRKTSDYFTCHLLSIWNRLFASTADTVNRFASFQYFPDIDEIDETPSTVARHSESQTDANFGAYCNGSDQWNNIYPGAGD
jgi:hypothetical protein